tara:strand:- start:40705 stop:40836 length:132 start_codon:yes stop_codon:yes gene_type:complete
VAVAIAPMVLIKKLAAGYRLKLLIKIQSSATWWLNDKKYTNDF